MSPIRLRSAFCLLVSVFCCCLLLRPTFKSHFNYIHTPPTVKSLLSWGIAEQIFVISLPNRADRRAALTSLWEAHRLEGIQYIDATSAKSPQTDRIIAHVRRQRRKQHAYLEEGPVAGMRTKSRPSFKDSLWKHPEELWGSDLWTLDSALPDEDPLDPDAAYPIPCERGNPFNPHRVAQESQYAPTPTATVNYQVPLLSRAMVACWHSHVGVIRRIALSGYRADQIEASHSNNGMTYIVLEDDVDFEWDITNFLGPVWNALPTNWEIVLLGHCWSDERRYPPIFELIRESSLTEARTNISLHPSNSPLCTHGYALSPRGAMRLYNLLRHPAFAYSRALDQAIAWLIRSGNLKGAYSIVPSLVIQAKDNKSDISERKGGSRWRDTLTDSTRERLRITERSKWWRRMGV